MSRFYETFEGCYDQAALETLCASAGVSTLTARALFRRGIRTPEQARLFLNPEIQTLADPLTLPDMPQAVVRICDAIKRDELICIYGDYDADGICALTILVRTLTMMGGRVTPYIPSRHGEGYGLNALAVNKLAMAHVGLIVTVDNGVGACDEIALAKKLGMDVIITDHHSIGATLPRCTAVVSAKRRDSAYPNAELCGAGVALQLSRALLPQEEHAFDLALAAVATVADVVPLVGENRAIVAQGLPHVADVPGFAALLHVAGWKGQQRVTEQTLAFLLAPRLNASGRMRDAMRGVELLLSEEEGKAAALASELDADNTARKAAEAAILERAEGMLDLGKRAILLAYDGWNPGVTGIVASRLCETYHRPVILFTEQNGLYTGSGRCPEGVHLYETLSGLSRYFVRFGGHARAAGVTMEKQSFAPFCEAFYAAMDALEESCFTPAFGYEEALLLSQLDVEAVAELQKLAPFGEGNPEPAYLFERAQFHEPTRMGKDGAHLSANVLQGEKSMRLVAFRQGERARDIEPLERYDLIARPGVNGFRGKRSVELFYVAMRPAQDERKVFDAIFAQAVYNNCGMDDNIAESLLSVCGEDAGFYAQAEMRRQYVLWQARLAPGADTPRQLAARYPAKQLAALLVFLQLGFFALDAERDRIVCVKNAQARPLETSALYKTLTAQSQRADQS